MPRPTKNLHVPLPDGLYAELRTFAEAEGRPATEIAREAIGRWIEEHRRTARRAEIAAYAAAHAGTASDLDPELERATVEHLRGARTRKRRRKA